MQTIAIEDIIVTDRELKVRQEIHQQDVDVLAEKIKEKGLFHAILLQNDGKTLIAGEHRMMAVKKLMEEGHQITHNDEQVPLGHIPFTRLADLGKLATMEAEIEENDVRVDVSWQERAAHTRKLYELRKAQAEERGEDYHMKDLSDEIYGGPRPKVVNPDILVGGWLDDEDVAKAKTRKDAIKVVERKLNQAHRERLANDYQSDPTKSKHTLIQGDLLEELPKLEDGSFECIITDPPYGISADKFKNQSAVAHSYDDSEEYADKLIKAIFEEGYRVTSSKAHIYMFHDVLRFPVIKKMAQEAGWDVWKRPLIWYRGRTNGLLPRPKHGPRRSYEAILYAIKGDRETQCVLPDVFDIPHERGVERGAHKPVDLYEALINMSCLPGDRVLDPSCGTAPILTAATRANVKATAIELEAAAFGQALERLEKGEEMDEEAAEEALAQFE